MTPFQLHRAIEKTLRLNPPSIRVKPSGTKEGVTIPVKVLDLMDHTQLIIGDETFRLDITKIEGPNRNVE